MYVEVGIERNKSIFTHISLFEEVKLAKIIPSGNIKSFYSISLHLNDHENPTYQFQTFPVNSHIYRETDVLYLVNSISELELLQPLFIASDRTIISGHRRFSAIRPLGWEEVLCKIKRFQKIKFIFKCSQQSRTKQDRYRDSKRDHNLYLDL